MKEMKKLLLHKISHFPHQNLTLPYLYLGASPSDEDFAYTMSFAASRTMLEKHLTQIERADLENAAKTKRKFINFSVKFCLPTSCQVSPYYSLSLSR